MPGDGRTHQQSRATFVFNDAILFAAIAGTTLELTFCELQSNCRDVRAVGRNLVEAVPGGGRDLQHIMTFILEVDSIDRGHGRSCRAFKIKPRFKDPATVSEADCCALLIHMISRRHHKTELAEGLIPKSHRSGQERNRGSGPRSDEKQLIREGDSDICHRNSANPLHA